MNNKGFTGVEIAIAVAIFGGLLYAVKPGLFPGSSKRAATSTETTKAVEAAYTTQGAVAAASISKMNEAVSFMEEIPLKTFLSQESRLALTRLPSPDLKELLEAEKRRSAVFEGRASEYQKLYLDANGKTVKLNAEVERANAAKHASDLALEKAAAAEHAEKMQKFVFIAIAVMLLAAWLYAKIYNISPNLVGKMVADMRAGVPGIQAVDTYLAPRFLSPVRKASKLATEPKDDA